jgi:hypothetical protein
LTEKITHLSFGTCFKKEIELTKNIKNLSFGGCFNQKIKLTENITNLSFGNCFNKKNTNHKKIQKYKYWYVVEESKK